MNMLVAQAFQKGIDIRRVRIPAPGLLDWMKLRISLERERFYAGAWRQVLREVRDILGKTAGAARGCQ
jgi:hypothetical protein